MNVLSLITLRISTNYTTIYREHGVKNASRTLPTVTNEIEQTNEITNEGGHVSTQVWYKKI